MSLFKKIDFTHPGGLFVYQDTLDFMQDAYGKLADTIALFFGEKVIVAGCVVTGGNISDGWVVLNGELLPVVGGTLQSYVFADELEFALQVEQYDNGTQQTAYSSRSLKFTSVSSGNTAWSLFKRVPFKASTLLEAFTKIQTIISNTVGVESAVILSGCDVSSVVGTTSGTCTISAGIVLMDGEYVVAPLRTAGNFPCYLKPDGTYVESDPGGTRVKFDYETSQRYKHVMKRFQHQTGEVVMSLAAADQALFSVSTGLGKWKWLGWKISSLMHGRVPVGFDERTSDPSDGVWDSNYSTTGNAVGVGRSHSITQAELPHIKLDVPIPTTVTSKTEGGSGKITCGNDDDEPSAGPTLQTDYIGSGIAMDLRQPGRVMLFIERL